MLVSASFLLAAGPYLSAQTLRDQRGPGIVDRGIYIPKAELTLANARQVAQRFLNEEAKGAAIARLIISTDAGSLTENYAHGTPHNTYESTLENIRSMQTRQGPVARLLSVGGRAKLSYFDEGKLTEENMPGGPDPTLFQIEDVEYELLHFVLGGRGPAINSVHPYYLRVFFKASPRVSVSNCIRLFQTLRNLIHIEDLRIDIRPDPWFMEEQRYPAVLMFTKPVPIPNSVKYLVTPRVVCDGTGGKVECSGQNFLP